MGNWHLAGDSRTCRVDGLVVGSIGGGGASGAVGAAFAEEWTLIPYGWPGTSQPGLLYCPEIGELSQLRRLMRFIEITTSVV